jgi:hypothetical protein
VAWQGVEGARVVIEVSLPYVQPSDADDPIAQLRAVHDGNGVHWRAVWLCDGRRKMEDLLVAPKPGFRLGPTQATDEPPRVRPSLLDTAWGRRFFSDWSE